MWLIITVKQTIMISPNYSLLMKLGEKLGIEDGPFKIEKVADYTCYLKKVA